MGKRFVRVNPTASMILNGLLSGGEPTYSASIAPPAGTLYTATNLTFTATTDVPTPTYTWSVGSGVTIVAGQGTSFLTVNFSASGSRTISLSVGGGGTASAEWTGTVAVWVPTALTGLGMWFKADAINTEDDLDPSGNVEIWRDQSGNGRDVTQDTQANRPAWLHGSVPGNINGLPTLHFNTGTKLLASGANSALRNKDGWTAFAYYRLSTTSSNFATILAASTNGSITAPRAVIGLASNTARTRAGWRRLDADSFSSVERLSAAADGSLNLLVGRLDFRAASLSSLARLNGTSTNGSAPAAGLISNTTSDIVLIGRQSTLQFYGHIGEILLYDRALSDAEIGQIETYLIGRWGAHT
jgi:hypothetical protein